MKIAGPVKTHSAFTRRPSNERAAIHMMAADRIMQACPKAWISSLPARRPATAMMDAEAHDELSETPPAGERARGLLPPGEDENTTQDRRHRDGDERDGRHVEEH